MNPALDEVVVHQTERLQDGAFALARLIVTIAAKKNIQELAYGPVPVGHVDDVGRLHGVADCPKSRRSYAIDSRVVSETGHGVRRPGVDRCDDGIVDFFTPETPHELSGEVLLVRGIPRPGHVFRSKLV